MLPVISKMRKEITVHNFVQIKHLGAQVSAAPFTSHADATCCLQQDAAGASSAVVSGEKPVVFTLPIHCHGITELSWVF